MGCLLLIVIPPSLRLKKSDFCSKCRSTLDYNPQHLSPITILAKVTRNWFFFSLFFLPFRGQHLTSVQQRTRNLFRLEERAGAAAGMRRRKGGEEEERGNWSSADTELKTKL
uniref:Uncharacterized protein n=1 Tax=Micrurus lemniscatus lemniscatus TaxID=129467 RepID=A0A2D4I1J6_MICLE